MLDGNVSAAALGLVDVIAPLRDGSLSAIGIAARRRFGLLPDTPVLDEGGIPLSAFVRCGVGVPAGTPADIIDRINHDLAQAMQAPDIRERLAALGLEPATSTPQEFADIIREDTKRIQRLVRAGKISAD